MSEDEIRDGLENAAVALEETTNPSQVRESPTALDDQVSAKIDEARSAVANLAVRAKTDKGAPFEQDALCALSILRVHEPAHFQRVRDDLKQAGVPMRDLNRELQKIQFRLINGSIAEGDEIGEQAGPYRVIDGAIYHLKQNLDGSTTIPLCNFVARIVEEVVRDDGVEQTVVFVLEGVLRDGPTLRRVDVPANRYSSMNWVTENWGSGPVVFAGFGAKDHLRVAIQRLSGRVLRRTVYTHLGWRKIDDEWVYLHGSGAIGPNGPRTDIEVQVGDTRLTGYDLP